MGEKWESELSSYVHIKYPNDKGKTFTNNNWEDTGDWIGIYTNSNSIDNDDVMPIHG